MNTISMKKGRDANIILAFIDQSLHIGTWKYNILDKTVKIRHTINGTKYHQGHKRETLLIPSVVSCIFLIFYFSLFCSIFSSFSCSFQGLGGLFNSIQQNSLSFTTVHVLSQPCLGLILRHTFTVCVLFAHKNTNQFRHG